ncbi:MAG TPA: hypothetical protein VJ768_08885 [Anaerolineales bacterium]|nr:hypothetical protein [Anaerolineales bacterium]
MAPLMSLLRLVHIFSGVAWVGIAFVNIVYLQPAIRATAPEGQKVMQYLVTRTRFTLTSYVAATLTVLSGLIMFGLLSQFRPEYFSTPYGTFLTIGALAGIAGWVLVIFVIRGTLKRMQAVGRQIQTQGGPPTAEQGAEMNALNARLSRYGQIGLILIAIALFGMSVAQYAGSF